MEMLTIGQEFTMKEIKNIHKAYNKLYVIKSKKNKNKFYFNYKISKKISKENEFIWNSVDMNSFTKRGEPLYVHIFKWVCKNSNEESVFTVIEATKYYYNGKNTRLVEWRKFKGQQDYDYVFSN